MEMITSRFLRLTNRERWHYLKVSKTIDKLSPVFARIQNFFSDRLFKIHIALALITVN